MKKTILREIGEFGLIRKIREFLEARQKCPEGSFGIGDDTAIIRPPKGYEILITTDAMVEGRHFLIQETSFKEIGQRAMVQNISDIGAMGGTPYVATVSLSLTDSVYLEDILALYEGFMEELTPFDAAIVGGNITKGPNLQIHITLLGIVEEGMAVLRSGAKEGDRILVTGSPGSAHVGLLACHRKIQGFDQLKAAYLKPKHRAREARLLAQNGLCSAMIDISDGLLGDLAHICEESGRGAVIDLDSLPKSKELISATEAFGLDIEEVILGPSDDYELLFTLPEPLKHKARALLEQQGLKVSEIGEILTERGIWLKKGGSLIHRKALGWDHFRDGN